MRSLAAGLADHGWLAYSAAWERVALGGTSDSLAVDAWMRGWRYLSLNALVLSEHEAASLRHLTVAFGRLLDIATAGVLADSDWRSELAWPWPAVELARHEPPHPLGRCTLYGRFDWLLDQHGRWQLAEFNADTPSGGREAAGWEPRVLRVHGGSAAGLRRLSPGPARLLVAALRGRLRQFEKVSGRGVTTVGVVSSHQWVEDMAQVWWLAGLLERSGQSTLVGDVTDLSSGNGQILLRGQPIEALYRFYPIEALYRQAIFAPLMEAAITGQLLLLNGLRGFLAQSKLVLAWLWAHRRDPALGPGALRLIERHLPATLPARAPAARRWLNGSVVKHVNGREGDSVVDGAALDTANWEARLLEGGYVVQRRVQQAPLDDLLLDEWTRQIAVVHPRYACVGTFRVGGRFGGCYSRMDGPVTTARATFVSTFQAAGQGVPARAGAAARFPAAPAGV